MRQVLWDGKLPVDERFDLRYATASAAALKEQGKPLFS